MHPERACQVGAGDQILGVMGEVHPDVVEIFEFKQKIFLFELNFQKLGDSIKEQPFFKAPARFPAVTRDLALIVEDQIPAGDLLRTLWEANNGLVAEIKLFDLYRGKPIPPGKKSLAFRLKYQQEDRTLTDREVSELHQKMIDLLAKRYGAILR